MVGVVLAAAGSEAATRARDPTRFMVTRRLREKRELGGKRTPFTKLTSCSLFALGHFAEG